jgi:hypothetical protein
MQPRSQPRRTVLPLVIGLAGSLALLAPETTMGASLPAVTSTPSTAVTSAWHPVHGDAGSTANAEMAPGTGGRLFVAVGGEHGTVVAALDARGGLIAGWPVELNGWTACWLGTVQANNSVRLVCHDAFGSIRAFAFDARGHRITGWPADISGRAGSQFQDYQDGFRTGNEPRIVGDRLFILLKRWEPDQALRLVRVSARGAISVGQVFPTPVTETGEWDWTRALGADGTAFAVRTRFDQGSGRQPSQVTAFGLDGPRSGWPVTISTRASLPVVGPRGRVYVVVNPTSTRVSRVWVYTRNGRRLSAWSSRLPVAATSDWRGAGAYNAAPPVVSATGSAWLVSDAGGTTAWALTSAGQARAGWPYRSRADIADHNPCPVPTTGCGWLRVTPVVGPGGVLYLSQDPRSSTVGGRIVAIGRDGKMQAGWPITLVNPGARFRSVAVAANGTVFGLAIEPAGTAGRHSATIVAIAANGSVIYRRTVVAP